MTWLYADRIGDRVVAKRFLWKRVVRIYPVFWLVSLLVVPIYFLFPATGHGNETDPQFLAASVLLLPTEGFPVLSVAWTLQYEVYFYFLFAGLIAFPRVFGPIVAVVAAAAFAALFVTVPFPLYFYMSPWILLFLFGVAAARIARRGVKWPLAWVLAGLILFFVFASLAAFTELDRGITRNGTGLGAAMTVIGLVCLESAGRVRVPRWLAYGGDISYALYLVHFPVLSLSAKVVFALKLQRILPQPVIALGLVLTCIVVAIALHELFEKQILRMRPRGSGPDLGAEPPPEPKPISA
jgi:exopolysaccharide production protein ExoZ